VSARRFWIPEVLQTSLMDCGPAALKALLDGFGIQVSYDTLRERCATDVDGTSISALARLGSEFGLHGAELLVPRDNFCLPEARCLPAIVVTRGSSGQLHFIVVWKRWGPFLQILDPSSGRRWVHQRRVLAWMPDLPIPLSEHKWRRWAASEDALAPLRARLGRLGVRGARARALIALAAADPSWRAFGALDAGARMLATWVQARAVRRGREVARLLEALLRGATGGTGPGGFEVPPAFHWVSERAAAPGKLIARGSVIVHFEARPAPRRDTRSADELPLVPVQRELGPMRLLWRLLRADSGERWLLVLLALGCGALLMPLEGLLLRVLLDLERELMLDYQRVAGVGALWVAVAVGLWLDVWAGSAVRRAGRRLELELRAALLEQLPRLPDHYLQSRPSSDMAARAHALHLLRDVPALWAQLARAGCGLLALSAALAWLYPEGWLGVLCLGLAAGLVPLLARRPVSELALRLRTHQSSLGRFHLDALLGVSPIRAHAAERAVTSEHERLLTEWASTAQALHVRQSALLGLQSLLTHALALGLVVAYAVQRADAAQLLLVALWALGVPGLAAQVVGVTLALRSLRGVVLRLLAPLDAARVPVDEAQPVQAPPGAGVELVLERASVRAGGHTLLEAAELQIAAGSHVAIVGASGAGKSSLLGLFLGWLAPSSGSVRVDGELLDASRLARLRESTAWIDPAVRLWDQSLYDNLVFGDDEQPQRRLGTALAGSDLSELLEQLPEGLQAGLGEGGVRLSGGQGQRVRLGRGLMRQQARLVLLDEPFRGLERERRRELLRRVREH